MCARALLAALLIGCLTRDAHAQSQARRGDADAAFRSAIEAGVRAYARRDWLAAQFHFEAAHRVQPSARTLRALGLTARQQRRYADAAVLLSRALRSGEQPLTEAMQRELQTAIAGLDPAIARYKLVPGDAAAKVRVDGKAANLDGSELLLDPGTHQIVVERPGSAPIAQRVAAEPGLRSELRVDANAIHDGSGTPGTHGTSPRPDRSWTTQEKLALGAAAGSVAGLIVGVTFGVLAWTEDDASRGDCELNSCGPQGLAHRQTAFDHAGVSTAGFVAFGALFATALTLYWFRDVDDAAGNASDRAGVELQPGVSALTLRARW